jgi:hypothetical protein
VIEIACCSAVPAGAEKDFSRLATNASARVSQRIDADIGPRRHLLWGSEVYQRRLAKEAVSTGCSRPSCAIEEVIRRI